ncbi:flavin reductase family protein [Rhodococcus sp. KBS0724]|jgi:3-hydroxy-9,10-secoandrosta-1,3,5(10)-triene-9,17-dione monooxygenase reductase component|uniref:flavin reductase family protein n=1 Tax=Rhodococcus sp. KBS0724 TaxID=1179674 RepID=UPI00110D3AC2|nr:flavin reductase family protein [Rhodococcus sp. KBS0724]TSD49597.1 flavin reductase family protein [Rhodococcus sp. KBS0724]
MITGDLRGSRNEGRLNAAQFRNTLGNFCSGVTVITGLSPDGDPIGFACQSFTSLSIDPPQILVCPGKNSTSWPRIAATGRFTANVLAHDQQAACVAFGSSAGTKFGSTPWEIRHGAVLITSALAWIDCDIETIHDGGDHHIVVGAVRNLRVERENDAPLVFFRGNYGL